MAVRAWQRLRKDWMRAPAGGLELAVEKDPVLKRLRVCWVATLIFGPPVEEREGV